MMNSEKKTLSSIYHHLNLLFVTGKGGIGKSLISAAIAIDAARQGKRVLLVQQSAADHLGPLFGQKNIGHEGLEVLPGLTVTNYTAGGNFRDFIVKHLKHGSLFESIAGNKVVHGFFTAIPGFGELMFLGRLYYALNLSPDRPDLVIVDSYASGHFVSLMTTPDAVLQSGLAGPIAAETKKVKDFLSDQQRCGVLVVGVPEELVVSEMVELIPKLQQKSPVKVAGVVFNRDLRSAPGFAFKTLEQRGDAAAGFLVERYAAQEHAMKIWSESPLSKQPYGEPILVPELGFIDEPISTDVVDLVVNGSLVQRGQS